MATAVPVSKAENTERKATGFTDTPRAIAAALTCWAVRSRDDRVLDAGAGTGVFVFEAIDRLRELGATEQEIAANTIAVEQDAERLSKLRESLIANQYPPVELVRGDLFEQQFAPLDAVIGNPPYVRRWWLDRDLVEKLSVGSPRLTDLACHFTKHAARFLKPGGRLAVIIADSWLDARYGIGFKDFLLKEFHLRRVVGFPDTVFADVSVRPVLLLAERRNGSKSASRVAFQRLPVSGDEAPSIERLLRSPRDTVNELRSIPQQKLRAVDDWSVYLYAPDAYFDLVGTGKLVPLGFLADTRIGLQTFARDFFVLGTKQAADLGIEEEYLVPLLYSPRDAPRSSSIAVEHTDQLLFACAAGKHELKNTKVLAYIRAGENLPYQPRGRSEPVIGVQNRPRVSRARRKPWYNLKTEIIRRSAWPIILPRRIFVNYGVWANNDMLPASENFIEAKPKAGVDKRLLLGVLISSFAEMSLRVSAHQYGGGIYDLSPGKMSTILVPDVRRLRDRSQERVCQAVGIMSDKDDRARLDVVLCEVLEFAPDLVEAVRNACVDLRNRARHVGGRA